MREQKRLNFSRAVQFEPPQISIFNVSQQQWARIAWE